MAIGHIPKRNSKGLPLVAIEPFADKTVQEGKLFRRKHGLGSKTVQPGNFATLELVIPYNQAKLTEAEIIGCVAHDTVDLKVYDNDVGTISGYANVQLNQFGFSVVVPDGMYRDKSDYDADMIHGLRVEITYTNKGSEAVKIGANITLHEVVSA